MTFVVILLLLGAATLLGIALNMGPDDQAAINEKNLVDVRNKLVNEHIKQTKRKMDLEDMKRRIENRLYIPQVGDDLFLRKKSAAGGVDHSSDTNEMNAYNDLNRYPKEVRAYSPDNIVLGQLQDEDRNSEYDEEYREEFVRQFLENARKAGYEVKLDSNYKVIGVRKVNKSAGGAAY